MQCEIKYLCRFMKYSRFIIIFLIISCSIYAIGQESKEFPFNVLLEMGYGIQIPGGNLQQRYGQNFQLNGTFNWIPIKNWTIGVSASILFGSTVKEDVLAPFRTIDRGIIGSDLLFAQIFLRQRGGIIGLKVGKINYLGKQVAIWPQVGIHRLQHHIRFQDDSQSVKFLNQSLTRALDRRSAGWGPQFSLTMMYLSLDGLANFAITLESHLAKTQIIRNFQYDVTLNSTSEWDNLWGIRASWLIPILSKENPDLIIY